MFIDEIVVVDELLLVSSPKYYQVLKNKKYNFVL